MQSHRLLSITIIILAALCILIPAVSASTYPANFSPIIPTNATNPAQITHYNQSYIIYDQFAFPWIAWFNMAWMGIIFFTLACLFSCYPERCGEVDALFGCLSTITLFIAAMSASSIDMVTSSGVTSQVYNGTIYWMSMENHMIYHYDITGYFFWIFSFIATLNTLRIIVNHRRITQLVGDHE